MSGSLVLTTDDVWWLGWGIAAIISILSVLALSVGLIVRATRTERASPLAGMQRLRIDLTALTAAGWPHEVYTLPNGQFCVRVPLGRSAGRSVDAFLVVSPDYPMRPPQVMAAAGRQQLPLTLPSLDAWTADSTLVRLMQEVVMQLPGAHPTHARRLTREGDLA